MREALHRCDPPCIPYLGMYLTDLSFIEEGTPNFTEDGGLLNFSKMRMVSHACLPRLSALLTCHCRPLLTADCPRDSRDQTLPADAVQD